MFTVFYFHCFSSMRSTRIQNEKSFWMISSATCRNEVCSFLQLIVTDIVTMQTHTYVYVALTCTDEADKSKKANDKMYRGSKQTPEMEPCSLNAFLRQIAWFSSLSSDSRIGPAVINFANIDRSDRRSRPIRRRIDKNARAHLDFSSARTKPSVLAFVSIAEAKTYCDLLASGRVPCEPTILS